MRQLIADYLQSMEHLRRAPGHTLRAYRRALEGFAASVETAKGRTAQPTDLDRAAIRSHLAGRRASVSAGTVAQELYVLRAFASWLGRRGKITDNPARQVRVPKVEQNVPRFLPVAQCWEILNAPRATSPAGARDRAILATLWGGGLRASELVGLDLRDLDLRAREVRVIGKGDRERLGPIGAVAVRAIRRWLVVRPKVARDEEPALFLSLSPNNRGARICERSIHRVVAAAGARVGAPALHPHVLRHSAATHMLANGAGLLDVMKFLGHLNAATTTRYAQVDLAYLRRAITAHPLEAGDL